MHQAISYSEAPSEFWLECDRCNTFVNTYVPQPHQAAVHRDPHLYIGNFGAYGTGKTVTSRQEIYKHIFLTPNANVLVCANIAAQYEQTIKRDIELDIPKAFIKYVSVQKSYIDFINGARIMFRPLDDPDKLRSLNLTMFVMVEASEVDGEAFQQLKTRVRNMAASTQALGQDGKPLFRTAENGQPIPVVDKDWRRGIIESNPDSGWIRTEVLYNSDTITKHGHVLDDYQVPENAKDPAIATHVASTDVNAFLPPTFIDELCKNKPAWWISRYVFSSFSYAEGLVYPSAATSIVPTYEVPQYWKRIIAADYGLSDDFVYLFGAIDERRGKLVIYKEVRTNNRNIEELSKLYHSNVTDIPSGGYVCTPLLDPKSGAKRDYNKKTLFDHFLDYGILFQPGHVNVDARVYRTNTYFESGRIEIMDCCAGLIAELRDYKFPPKSLTSSTRAQDKPIDKNNHGINPLEWMCMALPPDPKKLLYGAYDSRGNDLTRHTTYEDDWMPHALRDEEPEYNLYDNRDWF
jgi:hypothetical protein